MTARSPARAAIRSSSRQIPARLRGSARACRAGRCRSCGERTWRLPWPPGSDALGADSDTRVQRRLLSASARSSRKSPPSNRGDPRVRWATNPVEMSHERRPGALQLLALKRGLPRADRAQPQGTALRAALRRPGQGRRRAARGGLSRGQSPGSAAGAARRRPRDPAIAGDRRVPRRGLRGRGQAAAGDGAGAGAGARAGAADRLRHPPARQPARAQVPRSRVQHPRGRARALGAALDQHRPGRVRAAAGRQSIDRSVLRSRFAGAGRPLPGAADLQRPSLGRRPVVLAPSAPDPRRLHGAGGIPSRRARGAARRAATDAV